MRLFNRVINVLFNVRSYPKILVYEALSIGKAHIRRGSQTMLAHTVQYAKIHNFRATALLFRHVVQRHMVHFAGRFGMDISAGVKVVYHLFVTRQYCRQA